MSDQQPQCIYCNKLAKDFLHHWLFDCLEIPDEVWNQMSKAQEE